MESTKRTINIALIGSGAMGRAHAAAVANLRYCYNPLPFEAVLHTLITRDENTARQKADMLGFANYSTDYTAVLENPEIDVIDVCTPNICHYEEVKAALAHGKNVLCEKPLGITAAQAEELAALAEKTDSVCGVVFNNRHPRCKPRRRRTFRQNRILSQCVSAFVEHRSDQAARLEAGQGDLRRRCAVRPRLARHRSFSVCSRKCAGK